MFRKIVLGSTILLVLFLGYNLVVQITDAVRSQDRLSSQAETVYELEAENRQLKKKLSEVQSIEFIEKESRNKLGLGKAGETLVIIPEEKLKQILGASQSAVVRLPNWLGWFRIFFK